MRDAAPLRVAFLAGSLGQGGAEKQLLYLAREPARAGAEVRVLSLTCGDRYEALFARAGVPVDWAGRYRLPAARAVDIAAMLRRFRPHVLQAGHFFTNLYVVAAARACGATEIGAIRNDARFDMAECGRWGPPLLRVPRTLVTNSREAASNATSAGAMPERLHVLTNVIDLDEFDRAISGNGAMSGSGTTGAAGRTGAGCATGANGAVGLMDAHAASGVTGAGRLMGAARFESSPRVECVVIAVARLVPAKRLDRLIRALARVRHAGGRLRGVIAGDGPERSALEALARDLGLFPAGLKFLGARDDVPRLLGGADMLALTSQHEGFPNVLMEAMAARLPVVSTPAGDAATLVGHGRSGYVVPFDDEDLLVARLTDLATSPARRQAFGAAGRAAIEARYRTDGLATRALHIYHRAARQQHRDVTRRAVEAMAH